ncbi:MAG: hypothetical protein JNM56_08580 [Planctomycetia bacterium]|nr:hypothetical protein [Planctomycetia bacterium]
MNFRGLLALAASWFLVSAVCAVDPCVSGVQPGLRPGPYSFVLSTGTNRGQSQCFICETADKPAVVVFARTLSEPLGKLVGKLDKATTDHKAAELRGWITFLAEDQAKVDADVVRWTQQHALKAIPAGVFEDVVGPPSYKLAKDADVTVMLFVKRKVAANFAFRAGELNDDAIAEVLKALPKIVENKP